jgi:hypothetical protein
MRISKIYRFDEKTGFVSKLIFLDPTKIYTPLAIPNHEIKSPR